MPTIDEMSKAVAQIRAYCRAYTGKHRAYYDRLLESIDDVAQLRMPPDQPFDASQTQAGTSLNPSLVTNDSDDDGRVRAQFELAIALLLALTDRPNTQTLQNALDKLNKVAETNYTDVVYVGGSKDRQTLSALLPNPRKRTAIQREVLSSMRALLKPERSPFQHDGDQRGQ